MYFAMASTGQLLIILAVLCTLLNAAEEHRVKSLRKDWKFQTNVTFKYSRRFARSDNSFLYSVCLHEKSPSEMNCNVTISTPISPWNGNETQKTTCSVKLKGSLVLGEEFAITKVASIDRFEENRVIIVHWERQADVTQYEVEKIKITILQMDNCATNTATYAFDMDRHILLSNVVIYPRSFAIAISNRKICKTVACTIRHNIEGRRIGEPIPFVPNFATVQLDSVTSAPQDKNLYVSGADINAWKFKAVHVDPEGVGMSLMTVTAADPQKVNWTTSGTYGVFGICLMDTKKYYCAQFDETGPRMNATVRMTGPTSYFKAYNLKNDGMLLVTGYCMVYVKCRYFKVIKIGANGVEGKTVKEDLNMKCDRVYQDFFLDVAENKDEFCFYFACSHTNLTPRNGNEARKKVKFSSKCIPKSAWQ